MGGPRGPRGGRAGGGAGARRGGDPLRGGELAARLAAIDLPEAVRFGAPSSTERIPALPKSAAQRDRENRERLAADLRNAPPGARRTMLEAIDARLRELGRGGETVQLVEYDPSAFGGDGAVVVAIGDLDAARNIGVIVPGMGTTAASVGSVTRDAARLQAAARRADPLTATATVAWIGYDAPSGRGAVAQVLTGAHARRGAAELCADLADLARMRPDDPRVVVFGHSYGSTTAATAGAGGALAGTVDAMVLLGSPGAGPVRSAAELGMPVHVARDPDDPVPLVGLTDGAAQELRRRFGVELGLGTDPASPSFGAERIEADGAAGFGFGSHSGYFAEGSRSLESFARILTGAGHAR
ncbi:alpha/beta hydrolase [Tsukamurella sp. PLM1]|uniref:alpha/beta hydrolase n=1 Tax=Tsukamurella sp. PLM1 TaxID=2929795 RepID=UPI0020C16C31|nr:alpha/beta hydrolase [Tsukamurella sp. PLM1]